ncbi:hypothetical protein LTR60_000375 [Cryomyces antarcticus]|nr:hypothetical protein LTR60_000375 [Cryomyces antarcticus]
MRDRRNLNSSAALSDFYGTGDSDKRDAAVAHETLREAVADFLEVPHCVLATHLGPNYRQITKSMAEAAAKAVAAAAQIDTPRVKRERRKLGRDTTKRPKTTDFEHVESGAQHATAGAEAASPDSAPRPSPPVSLPLRLPIKALVGLPPTVARRPPVSRSTRADGTSTYAHRAQLEDKGFWRAQVGVVMVLEILETVGLIQILKHTWEKYPLTKGIGDVSRRPMMGGQSARAQHSSLDRTFCSRCGRKLEANFGSR